ncbi:unnamed protein product [Sphenostylis stenocarpa]|uniref:Uncharacterized protein n=1 Tax=Sphenostylis stenocarpa TaxID=92480 RepID=A0AA86W3F2_9FABA|nr:unnamed protein product [Sphenostylis stenocarpa]
MDERKHSISSFFDLGMPSIFGAYAPTPPSAQGFEGPYQQSPDNIQYHNETVSSSDTYKTHEDVEHHEDQPSEEEAPRPPQGRRNPTRNRRPRAVSYAFISTDSFLAIRFRCSTDQINDKVLQPTMTSTTFTVLVYFNDTILMEENYSETYISSQTAWVAITNTMTMVEVKQTILNHFNMSTVNEYEVNLQYRLPIFIYVTTADYRSCKIFVDDDVEALFLMATEQATKVQSWHLLQKSTKAKSEVYYDLANNFNQSLNLD